MGEGVDEPGEVVQGEHTEPKDQHEGAQEVVEEPTEKQESGQVGGDEERFVVVVLEHHQFVFEEVGNDFVFDAFGFSQDPCAVCVPETFFDRVRVFVGIDVSVVDPVVERPS
jgi:hypothetical protein